MPDRQLSILKIHSSRLKDQKYNLTIPYDEAKLSGEIVNLANNQILRTICEIKNRIIDFNEINRLYEEREKIYKLPHTKDNVKLLSKIQSKINKTLFIPEYVTVVIDHKSHYDYIFYNGVYINGKLYKRFSCSAGQARKSNVILLDTEILDTVKMILNNNRKMDKAFSPSKFNAYFGLYGSATKLVSEPKFIVIKDFENSHKVKVNYVTETNWSEDDKIEEKEIELKFNRTDGMGLISPRLSEQWAKELGLDYVPSQWCVRQSFIKGMLCTFPIHQFCEEINHGNYIVDTIYTDASGNPIKADLRDYDVIISESQFKLWDSYNSITDYINSCHKNNLYWGVSQYTPKQANNILKLNYQFIQTLNLNDKDIEELCYDFLEWIKGVSFENYAYMILFLSGVGITEKSAYEFMRSSDAYWIKSLIAYPNMIHDKYVRDKIKDLIRVKMKNSCLGEIFIDGNFQVLVSDPYAFMQHVCGLPVTGLLKEGESYSNYWNERNVKQVDSMRSPLTYKSEHILLNLRKDDTTEKWYRYCKLGIILNYYGHEAMMAAGADFDFDILATSSHPVMIRCAYRNELPVYYDPPKPKKIIFSEFDLYQADCFSFGSIIGQITNKSSNAYALIPNLVKQYGEDSEEVKLTESRLQQCCKAQSMQIDKAKIGKEVKGIPKVWTEKQLITDNDDETTIKQKELLNRCLLNKHPYFFIYRYRETNLKYKNYIKNCDTTCMIRFGISIDDLLKKEIKSEDEKKFIDNYYNYMPIIYSDSSMNKLCRYIEVQNINILKKSREETDKAIFEKYKNYNVIYSEKTKNKVVDILKKYIRILSNIHKTVSLNEDKDNGENYLFLINELKHELLIATNNIYEITNYLIDYYYLDNPKSNKKLLWDLFGKYIFQNIVQNLNILEFNIPIAKPDGEIKYLGNCYSLISVRFKE